MKKLLPLLLLSACSSYPAFRKGEDLPGYTVRQSPIPEILDVHATLPPGTDEHHTLDYLTRAAAEECAARGLPYFDLGLTREGGARAFCHADAHAAHLGATFALKAAASTPPELRVEDTQLGKFAPLRPWDVIRKVNGREVRDVAGLKEAVFLAAKQGLKRVSVLVERSDIALSLECPLSFDAAQLGGPEQLEDLRSKMK